MAEKEKKQEEMKRRDFLLKAAEAAALALFGGMGLAEVTKAVARELEYRRAANQLASQVVRNISVQRVQKCLAVKYTCYGYQERLDCGKFDCKTVFTCIGGDFSCDSFDCDPVNRYRCYGYSP